jgi:hypothetical protein
MVQSTNAIDVTAANYPQAPTQDIQVCLYVTGTPDIVSTPEMREAHPDAVLIDQSPADSGWDETADVQDYENGAVTLEELPERIFQSGIAWINGNRPGQRLPAVYVSRETAEHNSLPYKLWIADYSLTHDMAVALLGTTINGGLVIGVQYGDEGTYDYDVFSTEWLNDKSKKEQEKVSITPGNGFIDVGDVAVGQTITVYYSDNVIAKQEKVIHPGAQRITGLKPGSYNVAITGNDESAYIPDVVVK